MSDKKTDETVEGIASNRAPSNGDIIAISRLMEEASNTATEKGFWDHVDDVDDRFAECIALIHSELSEALEAHRNGDYGGGSHFQDDAVSTELADTVIRIFDLAHKMDERHGSYFAADLGTKMVKNRSRDHKHGKEY